MYPIVLTDPEVGLKLVQLQGFRSSRFLKTFVNAFSLFRYNYYLPLEKKNSFTQGCFAPDLVEMDPLVLKEKAF